MMKAVAMRPLHVILVGLIVATAGCSLRTQARADATRNSAAADADAAGHAVARETAGTRKSLAAAGHDLTAAADKAGDEAERLVKKADREMRSDK